MRSDHLAKHARRHLSSSSRMPGWKLQVGQLGHLTAVCRPLQPLTWNCQWEGEQGSFQEPTRTLGWRKILPEGKLIQLAKLENDVHTEMQCQKPSLNTVFRVVRFTVTLHKYVWQVSWFKEYLRALSWDITPGVSIPNVRECSQDWYYTTAESKMYVSM